MHEEPKSAAPAGSWRLTLGLILFGVSIALPLVGVPIVASIGLPIRTAGAISGAMVVGAELLGIASIAVMGKAGYAFIKNMALGFLKRHGPPDEVSRTRYRIGLFMFATPILFAWLTPYASDLFPWYFGNELVFAVVGDAIFLASLFVLGGNFWDKARGLFIHDAMMIFLKSKKQNE